MPTKSGLEQALARAETSVGHANLRRKLPHSAAEHPPFKVQEHLLHVGDRRTESRRRALVVLTPMASAENI